MDEPNVNERIVRLSRLFLKVSWLLRSTPVVTFSLVGFRKNPDVNGVLIKMRRDLAAIDANLRAIKRLARWQSDRPRDDELPARTRTELQSTDLAALARNLHLEPRP